MMIRYGKKVNLIICQKSKVSDWVNHFESNYINIHVLDFTDKKQFKLFSDRGGYQVFLDYSPEIYIINYELAWRRKILSQLEDFTLMLDESSLIQNKTAKQTKFILKMKPAHVILLSGTPVGGRYENLWTQCHLLGWGISEQLYQKQYVNWKLTEDDGSGVRHKIVDKTNPYKNIERLKSKMREYGAVFKKTDECFELPEQIFQEIKVPATKEYWKFMKDCIITIDTYNLHEFEDTSDFYGQDVTPKVELIGDTMLTKILYLRQLASQYNKNKIDAFKDLLASTQDRLIVFYNFDTELEQLKKISKTYNRPISEINGHCKDLTAYEHESNSVTLCQYQSASKGHNLQKCNRIIYFSLCLSSEDFEQSKKRIHRIGQNKPCFYYILTARGTIDNQILKTLEERRDFTDELFKENSD
ncbi:Phage helicase [Lachnospiraceae bacterium TWA4]|nr:Phage helicase [Lachnospiraceae bacterium TWA4]